MRAAMTATWQAFSLSVASHGALVLTGVLHLSIVRELRDAVDEVMAPGQAIVLDLAERTFMDGRWDTLRPIRPPTSGR
jgi:hypothetical protein